MDILKKTDYGLSICIAMCAVMVHYAAYDPLLTIRHFIWSLFVIGLFGLISYRGDFGAIRSPAVWLLGGYAVFVCLSGFMAVNKSEWLYEAFRIFVMLTFLIIAITLASDNIYPVMTIVALGLSVFGLIRLLNNHINGFGCNQNQWAECLVLLIPFAWRYKWVVLLLLINILFTRNRASFVAVGVMLFILLDRKMKYILVGFIVLALTYFFFFQRSLLLSPGRIAIWTATLNMIKDYPLGVGAGNWKLMIPLYGKYCIEPSIFQILFHTKPHNDYLWVLSETGPGGLLCYIGFFIFLIKKARNNKVLLAGITGYMLLAFFSFPMERAISTILLLTLAGLILKDNYYKPIRFTLWPVVMIILICASADFGLRHIGGMQAKKVRISREGNEKIKISWFATMDDAIYPLYTTRGLRKYELNDIRGAMEDFQRACRVSPNNPAVLTLMGSALINTGRPDEAAPYIKKSLAISPEFAPTKTAQKFLEK